MSIPDQSEIAAAWMRLPAAERDRLGFIAVDMVFQGFVFGDACVAVDRLENLVVFDEDVRSKAGMAEDRRLNELTHAIKAALPDLFGPDGENPAWSENAGPTPTPAALAYATAWRQGRIDHKHLEKSLRIRLGLRGFMLCIESGAYVVADKNTREAKTEQMNLGEVEAWLTNLGIPGSNGRKGTIGMEKANAAA